MSELGGTAPGPGSASVALASPASPFGTRTSEFPGSSSYSTSFALLIPGTQARGKPSSQGRAKARLSARDPEGCRGPAGQRGLTCGLSRLLRPQDGGTWELPAQVQATLHIKGPACPLGNGLGAGGCFWGAAQEGWPGSQPLHQPTFRSLRNGRRPWTGLDGRVAMPRVMASRAGRRGSRAGPVASEPPL